jgi:hypothetical protein
MLIYRIENKDGEGPYWCRFDFPYKHPILTMGEDHCADPVNHPSASKEMMKLGYAEDEFTKHHVCGFGSIDQMVQWFDSWLNQLEEWGFYLVEITINANDIMIGNTQVAFDSRKVLCKKQIPLSSVCPAMALT